MSMYKEIIFNDQKYSFKVSAGTEILYKRFWGQELDEAFKQMIGGIIDGDNVQIADELKTLMTTVTEIQKMNDSDPEKIRRGLEIWSKYSGLLSLKTKKVEFSKKFGYITAMEAEHEPADIDKYLTNSAFTAWLMTINEQFFQDNADAFASFYLENFNHTSTPKKGGAAPTA